MSRVPRLTYAAYIRIQIHQYSDVHGIIEEFGGRVKQFTQDLLDRDDWLMFYEMSKQNKEEFVKEMGSYLNGAHTTTE